MADFIITSLQSWDTEIGCTVKNTALEISRQHRVLYISTPSTLIQYIKDIFRSSTKNVKQREDLVINDNLRVIYCSYLALPVSGIPFHWLFRWINYINNKRIALCIQKAILRYKFNNSILLIDNDIFRSLYLKQLIRPAITVYYRRDYVIGVDYWKRYGPECEQQLVKQSDIVITNSSYFTQELKPLNQNIYTTNTGVDLVLYDASLSHDIPSDLIDIPSPRVGYTGAIIESRLNAELLYVVAKQLSQYNFVFVGPEDEFFVLHPLHTLDNVYFLGKKEVDELPAYIQHFDICINPQVVNPITEGNYPLKIDEYLAMGKPVVATSTHTMREVFAEYTYLATDANSYMYAIQQAVNEINDNNLKAARIAFAHTHSWAHSVEKIYAAIEEYKRGNQKEIS